MSNSEPFSGVFRRVFNDISCQQSAVEDNYAAATALQDSSSKNSSFWCPTQTDESVPTTTSTHDDSKTSCELTDASCELTEECLLEPFCMDAAKRRRRRIPLLARRTNAVPQCVMEVLVLRSPKIHSQPSRRSGVKEAPGSPAERRRESTDPRD